MQTPKAIVINSCFAYKGEYYTPANDPAPVLKLLLQDPEALEARLKSGVIAATELVKASTQPAAKE